MTRRIERDPIYRCRRFSAETIELCVRWYITYRLSYRNLAAMMAERDVIVSHTTIMRWVLRYVPEYERRWARFARPPGSSWRMDETAVPVRGGRHYLFRAVDKSGKSVGSLLCNDRNMESAQAFFRSVVAHGRVPWPDKINIDGNKATLRGLRLLGEEDHRWRQVEVRTRRYLNNVVEQDHRAIKQRCASMLGLAQILSFCGHYLRGSRTRPSHSKRAVRAAAEASGEAGIAEGDLALRAESGERAGSARRQLLSANAPDLTSGEAA
jgi:transposase-like protein